MNITCEVASLADAVQKAARVAPTKGAAYDKAAGLIIEPTRDLPSTITVRATDLDTTIIQRVPNVEIEGAATWRLPAGVFADFMKQLPLDTGASVTLRAIDGGRVEVKCGRTRARFQTIDPEGFPHFEWFDPEGLAPVSRFAQLASQITWATDRDADPLTGIHIDGKRLIACDKARLAEVDCAVPVDEPITVPMTNLAPALKNTSEVRLAAVGDRLLMMPDGDTQATSRIFAEPYPNVDGVRNMGLQAGRELEVSVEGLTQVLQRMMVLCKGERYPLVKLGIGNSMLAVQMDVPELGEVTDAIDVNGADHELFVAHFTPTYILNALGACAGPLLKISYPDDPLRAFRFWDGLGFSCVAMPRRVGS